MNKEYKNRMEQSTEFQDWKRRRSRYYLQNTVLILSVVFFVSMGLLFAGIQGSKMKDIVFAAMFLIVFLAMGIGEARKWILSYRIGIEEYWIGTVTELYRNLRQNKKVKNYRIVADVDGKVMEGICLLDTYKNTKIGDSILLFTIGTDVIYCIPCDVKG